MKSHFANIILIVFFVGIGSTIAAGQSDEATKNQIRSQALNNMNQKYMRSLTKTKSVKSNECTAIFAACATSCAAACWFQCTPPQGTPWSASCNSCVDPCADNCAAPCLK